MSFLCLLSVALLLFHQGGALRYDPALTQYNLNQNQTAVNPLDFWGEWTGHQYHPSPINWRFPFYTLFLDRFVNGDPSNDNINGTAYEHDLNSNQMRHGGDLEGLVDTLDYLHGMGIKVRRHSQGRHNWTDNIGYLHCRITLHQ
jgi:alpha-1,3-glucan synthase